MNKSKMPVRCDCSLHKNVECHSCIRTYIKQICENDFTNVKKIKNIQGYRSLW